MAREPAGESFVELERLEMRSRWRRRGVLLLLLGLAVVGGVVLWRVFFGGSGEETRQVETVPVTRTTIRATIAASGTAEAADETELRFAAAGRAEKILATLGQQVKAGDPLAVLETDDLKNRLATAEANETVARIRLRQILKGADEAELLAADQAVATAQAAVSKGQRDLDEVLDGPSEADIAAAEQNVATAKSNLATAEAKLAALIQSPSPSELASAQAGVTTAEQSVASAQSTRDSARAKLAQLQSFPSAADTASSQASLTNAQVNVSTAENLVDSAESSLDSADGVLRAAGDAYCNDAADVGLPDYGLCPFSLVPLDQPSVDRLVDMLDDPSTDVLLDPECEEGSFPALCPTLRTSIQTLLNANSSYVSADNSLSNAQLSLEAAQAAETAAQANFDALGDTPSAEDLQAAEAAVTAAEEGVEAAQANLVSAQARVDDLAPSSEDLAAAQAAVDSADEAVQAAEAKLQELQEGASTADIQAAEDAVRSAEANLSAAIAKRDDLIGGADPDDVDLQVQQVRLAEITVSEARKALDEATLKAPFDGTVGSIDVGVGDLVSTQLPAVTLLTPGALKVRLTIGETDLPSLRQGMVGLMLFDALQDKPFPVVVTALGLQPSVEQGIVTYVVEAALLGVGEDAASRPAPGMNGSAILVTEERKDVLSVPNRAIRRRGDEVVVEVIVDGKSEIRVVETGLSDTDNSEVLSGVEEGEQVVVPSTGLANQQQEQEALPEGVR
jgi:RND family efflux transporter MFP subunit